MNILIICRYLSLGGAERVTASWANGLKKLGNKIYILTDISIPQTYYTDPQIEIIPLPKNFYRSKGLYESFINRFNYIKILTKIIDEKSIDAIIKVMHVNSIELLIARNRSIRKPPIIMTDHNAYERPASAPMSFRLKLQKFYLNRLFDKVTVLTNRDKEITSQRNLNNIETLYNPLFLKSVEHLPHKENIVLAVGRIDSWHYKGFDILIKAWNKIYNQVPEWKLRIVGKGSDKNIKYLKGLVKDEDSIEFIEYTSDIQRYYSTASIFVLSSRYEAWGLVLLEAMSQGCACIACDYLGRQSEIIKNYENGILCSPENVDVLAKTIENVIHDSNLRLKLQTNAPLYVDRFSEENVAKNLFNIIKETIK